MKNIMNGPILIPSKIEQSPLNLVEGFTWYDIDINNPDELDCIYTLLQNHYVEDSDNTFRLQYDKNFLQWALTPPGYKREWHTSVKTSNGKIIAFISAIPVDIVINGIKLNIAEINFLCVHKKLRKHRLTPVLIKEITRRVNIYGIFQAVYTAGVTLSAPIAECQYYHRSLNPKKLIELEFTSLTNNMNLARTIRLYKLPNKTATIGLRLLLKLLLSLSLLK